MERHTNCDEAMKASILDKHLSLGPQKPVSYLPIGTIEKVLELTVKEYRAMIHAKGHESVLFPDTRCAIKSGAVYGYSASALEVILAKYRSVLLNNGWPVTPAKFIEKVAANWIEDEESALFSVIREAFGEV